MTPLRRWWQALPGATRFLLSFAGFAGLLIVAWYAFNGIGQWKGLNELGDPLCVHVQGREWRCPDGVDPNWSNTRPDGSYYVRTCTFVRRDASDPESPNIYRCTEEEG